MVALWSLSNFNFANAGGERKRDFPIFIIYEFKNCKLVTGIFQNIFNTSDSQKNRLKERDNFKEKKSYI